MSPYIAQVSFCIFFVDLFLVLKGKQTTCTSSSGESAFTYCSQFCSETPVSEYPIWLEQKNLSKSSNITMVAYTNFAFCNLKPSNHSRYGPCKILS